MLWRKRDKGPLIHAQGGALIARFALLLGVMAVTGWAFSSHFDRRMSQLEREYGIADELKTLNATERDALGRMVTVFQERWGIRVRVLVSAHDVLLPKLTGQTLFVGMAPARGQAMVVLPALARRALPPDTARQVEQQLMACQAEQPVGVCLNAGMHTLHNLLGEHE